jgi:hypothetical protein
VIYFVKSAVTLVEKAAADQVFGHTGFNSAKDLLAEARSLVFDDEPDSAASFGRLLGAVSLLGIGNIVDEESEEQKNKRVKMMTGRFKSKLERIKIASDTNGLVNCSGPGTMFCCALSCAPRESWGSQNDLQD